MTKQAKRRLANVEVVPATAEQKPLLANLIELYIHDFSEFLRWNWDRTADLAIQILRPNEWE